MRGEGCGEGFEARAAVVERVVEEELVALEEDVEGHEDSGDLLADCVVYALAADALGEDGEGESFVEGEVPAEDFAVEDERGGDVGEGFGEFGEALGDVFAVAGVDGDAVGLGWVAAVELGAHAVVFVLEISLDWCGFVGCVLRS